MIPMYRLRLHSLYGLYGPRCLLSPKRPLNVITHSLTARIDVGDKVSFSNKLVYLTVPSGLILQITLFYT